MRPDTEALAEFLAGFVAAEGSFIRSGEPPKFKFAVGLGATDRETCELLQEYLGVGHLPKSYKRQQHSAWKVAFLDYLERRARRRRACTVEGCDAPRRAHGLRRHHLWVYRRQ